jgi:hypothetical protein
VRFFQVQRTKFKIHNKNLGRRLRAHDVACCF